MISNSYWYLDRAQAILTGASWAVVGVMIAHGFVLGRRAYHAWFKGARARHHAWRRLHPGRVNARGLNARLPSWGGRTLLQVIHGSRGNE